MKNKVRQMNRLLVGAYKKMNEERAWDLYKAQYPSFTEENFKPFNEFYNPEEQEGNIKESKTAEEILKDTKKLMDSYKWR